MEPIDRRDFLKAAAQAGVGMAMGSMPLNAEGSQTARMHPPEDRKYFIWTGPSRQASEQQLKDKYRDLKAHGITGVFLENGIFEPEMHAIRDAGLELHSWMWTTNRSDEWIRRNHPDWYQVSRTGKSCFDNPPYVDYYRWISPVIPGVQRYLEDRVAELAAHPLVQGVHLDYVRYPDVCLPRALWEKYDVDETEELPQYDFCYSEHTRKAFKEFSGRDPMEIVDPARDQQWLHFRYDSVTHLVKKLTAVAHGHGKKITAAVFPTPHMARKICRQDWDKWPLDGACPMIYHSFYNEKVEWVGECVLENIQSVTFPIYAGLYMPAMPDPADFRKALQVSFHNGAHGVSLFGGLDDGHWKVFEEGLSR